MTRQEELEKVKSEFARRWTDSLMSDAEQWALGGAFAAGAAWEHERSKVLVEALERDLRTEEMHVANLQANHTHNLEKIQTLEARFTYINRKIKSIASCTEMRCERCIDDVEYIMEKINEPT